MLAPQPRLVVPGRELRGPDDWPRLFGRAAPLVVEIGFGKDTFLLERAARDPDTDHVGVERDPHRVQAFLQRAADRGLDNVRALPVTAEMALGLCLPDSALTELHVYFPDPWPKARHAAHRMIQPWFGREARRVLRTDGAAYLATDDADYAQAMLDVFERSGLFRNLLGPEATGDTPCAPLARAHLTKFERLWRRRGRTIRHLAFRPAEAGPA
jgi:tRNA (guanine-N7-)-methyltransferase